MYNLKETVYVVYFHRHLNELFTLREPRHKLLASEREKFEGHLKLCKMAFKCVKYRLKCKSFVVRTDFIQEGYSLFSTSDKISL